MHTLLKKTLFAALVGCFSAGAAADFESPELTIYYGADFGGPQPAALRSGLALRQAADHARDTMLPALASVDFRGGVGTAALAGVPLWRRDYRMNQAEEAAAEPADDGGWLSGLGDAFAGLGIGTGTAIVAGGIAVAVMLSSTDSDDPQPSPGGPGDPSPDDGGAPDGIITAGDNEVCVVKGTPPFPDQCANVPLAPSNSGRAEMADSAPQVPEDLTGWMGDLIAR